MNPSCVVKEAADELSTYGGHRWAKFGILLRESVLEPGNNPQRVLDAALAVAQKIYDMGYDLDWAHYHVQIVDDRVWNIYQDRFKRWLAGNLADSMRDIEECREVISVTSRDQPPARCVVFEYRRRMHLREPTKAAADFVKMLVMSDPKFAQTLRNDCRARDDKSQFCLSIATTFRIRWR
ncbi:hypothetical protein ACFSM5_15725 [Lacibacterium aquatile]|uniref:Uncharacterized protein n=1 Tax=Lacibacterium aquatile TaxID=1168082 RepID=A0ABW5DT80_9PROT